MRETQEGHLEAYGQDRVDWEHQQSRGPLGTWQREARMTLWSVAQLLLLLLAKWQAVLWVRWGGVFMASLLRVKRGREMFKPISYVERGKTKHACWWEHWWLMNGPLSSLEEEGPWGHVRMESGVQFTAPFLSLLPNKVAGSSMGQQRKRRSSDFTWALLRVVRIEEMIHIYNVWGKENDPMGHRLFGNYLFVLCRTVQKLVVRKEFQECRYYLERATIPIAQSIC